MSSNRITGVGWYLLSPSSDLSFNIAKTSWENDSDISYYSRIYCVKDPIAEDTSLNSNHWTELRIVDNPLLETNKGYWILVESVNENINLQGNLIDGYIQDASGTLVDMKTNIIKKHFTTDNEGKYNFNILKSEIPDFFKINFEGGLDTTSALENDIVLSNMGTKDDISGNVKLLNVNPITKLATKMMEKDISENNISDLSGVKMKEFKIRTARLLDLSENEVEEDFIKKNNKRMTKVMNQLMICIDGLHKDGFDISHNINKRDIYDGISDKMYDLSNNQDSFKLDISDNIKEIREKVKTKKGITIDTNNNRKENAIKYISKMNKEVKDKSESGSSTYKNVFEELSKITKRNKRRPRKTDFDDSEIIDGSMNEFIVSEESIATNEFVDLPDVSGLTTNLTVSNLVFNGDVINNGYIKHADGKLYNLKDNTQISVIDLSDNSTITEFKTNEYGSYEFGISNEDLPKHFKIVFENGIDSSTDLSNDLILRIVGSKKDIDASGNFYKNITPFTEIQSELVDRKEKQSLTRAKMRFLQRKVEKSFDISENLIGEDYIAFKREKMTKVNNQLNTIMDTLKDNIEDVSTNVVERKNIFKSITDKIEKRNVDLSGEFNLENDENINEVINKLELREEKTYTEERKKNSKRYIGQMNRKLKENIENSNDSYKEKYEKNLKLNKANKKRINNFNTEKSETDISNIIINVGISGEDISGTLTIPDIISIDSDISINRPTRLKKHLFNIVTVNGGQYQFNGQTPDASGIELTLGRYKLKVPSSHPIGFSISDSNISFIDGDLDGESNINGNNYKHYHGTVVFDICGNFGTASYNCSIHGYMGGQNKVKFIANPNPPANKDNYIGKNGYKVRDILKKKYPDKNIQIIKPDKAVTRDYTTDRIRIYINNKGRVIEEPTIG